MKDSMDNVHQLLKDRDGLVETKNQFILEQKNKI
jgi:hypothetical protein